MSKEETEDNIPNIDKAEPNGGHLDTAAINTMRVRAFTELIDEQLNGMNLEEARTYLYELELVLRTKINAIDLSLNVGY